MSQFPLELSGNTAFINVSSYDFDPVPQMVNILCIFYISCEPELNVILGDKYHQLLWHQLQRIEWEAF